jgi:hypothetical protein
MAPLFAILTIITCVGIKALTQRVKQTHTTKERTIRRVPWGLTEEAFSKC